VRVEAPKFWDESSVYLVGYTKFHQEGFHEFMDDFGMELKEGQMRGTDGENVVEAGGRACYLSYGVGRQSKEYHENIMASKHGSVMRHAVANVMITGVSRGFTHELVRHAAGTAPSQSSSRYIPARKLGFVIPPEYRGKAMYEGDFRAHCGLSLDLYERHMRYLKEDYEQEHPDWSPTQRTKTARGAARGVLPINLNQVIQFSMNVQAFRHVLRMRGSEYAEREIREVACKLAPIGKQLWPILMQDVEVKNGEVHLEEGV